MIPFVLEALAALAVMLLLVWWTVGAGRKHDPRDDAGAQDTPAANTDRSQQNKP